MTEPLEIVGMGGSAVFSPDGRHRFRLDRWWEEDDSRRVVFVMLNPSIAGAHEDDQTIRKCVGFAKRTGFGRLSVVNLFSHIATQATDLVGYMDQQRLGSDPFIAGAANDADRIVLAWGSAPKGMKTEHAFRVNEVLTLLIAASRSPAPPFYCLGKTAAGYPRHPSRLPYATKMEKYS